MRVGILGSGVVAQALGEGFVKHGHEVMLGTRERAKLADWATRNSPAQVGSFDETARFGEMVVLAVKGTVVGEAFRVARAANISGKTNIHTANPHIATPPEHREFDVFTKICASINGRLHP